MIKQHVCVVSTGSANLASIIAAMSRLDLACVVTASPDEIVEARWVILPGVGSFGAAMKQLSSAGLVKPLRDRVQSGRPTLAICLGMQLLATESEESPGVPGLGIIPTTVKRFDRTVRVPQFGWNHIEAPSDCQLIKSGYAYFANSFMLPDVDASWASAISNYGAPFVAGAERGSVVALQCHPELSGEWGRDLLARWISQGEPRC